MNRTLLSLFLLRSLLATASLLQSRIAVIQAQEDNTSYHQLDANCGVCHSWCLVLPNGNPRSSSIYCKWKGSCNGCAECCPTSAPPAAIGVCRFASSYTWSVPVTLVQDDISFYQSNVEVSRSQHEEITKRSEPGTCGTCQSWCTINGDGSARAPSVYCPWKGSCDGCSSCCTSTTKAPETCGACQSWCAINGDGSTRAPSVYCPWKGSCDGCSSCCTSTTKAPETCGACQSWCTINGDGSARAPSVYCPWKGSCDGCSSCCTSTTKAPETCGACQSWCAINGDGSTRAPSVYCPWKGSCDGCPRCCTTTTTTLRPTLGPTPPAPPLPANPLISDTVVQDEYVKRMLGWDGRFAAKGYGISKTSLTCDHVALLANGVPNPSSCYTAPSKESLHIAMLALVVGKQRLAWHWMSSASDQAHAESIALERLEEIIDSYEKLNLVFPGLGGFIPWISVDDSGFNLERETNVLLPALDNGQLAWSMIAAAHALKLAGQDALAARFNAHVGLMKTSAPILFWNPANGKVWMNSKIHNARSPISTTNREGDMYLVDPYEGELMLMFLDIFCEWSNLAEKQKMWAPVKKNQIMVEYDHVGLPNGPISVQRGWRFSSHELWKYMVLPYTDNEHALRVLRNCERARTWNSKLNDIPGLFAAAYNSTHSYIDRYGIHSISMGYPEPPKSELHITPYSAFPLMLVDLGYGLAWHRAMLGRPHMQSVLGSVESSKAFGPADVAAYTSWDTKVTSNLAALGGICSLIRSRLQSESTKLDRFNLLVDELYKPYFPTLKGEATPYAEPPDLPAHADDFPNCQRLSPVEKVPKASSLLSATDVLTHGNELHQRGTHRDKVFMSDSA